MILLGERRPVPAQRTGAQSESAEKPQGSSAESPDRQATWATAQPRQEHLSALFMSYA